MELIVTMHDPKSKLDKDKLKVTDHTVTAEGEEGSVKVKVTYKSSILSDIKKMVSTEVGDPVDIEFDN